MEDSAKPDPQFIQSIQAGLRYWQAKTETLGPEQVQWLDGRRQNLHQAIQFGLTQPETWFDAAQLLLQAFDFGEAGGYWPDWVPVLEKALAAAPEKETMLYGRLQNRLGQLYRMDNRPAEAAIQHQTALALAQRLANDELLLVTYHCLAELSYSQVDIPQTRSYSQLALSLAQTRPEFEPKAAFTYRILGQAEEYLGNWAEAIQQFKKAALLWRKFGNYIYLARALNNLGNVYSKNKAYALAQEAYEEAGEILKTTISAKDKAITYLNLGVLFYRQEKWQEAEASLLQIMPTVLQANSETELLAFWHNNLGNIYLKMAKWQKAEEHLIIAIQILRDLGNELQLANSLGTIGGIYSQTGQTAQSLSCYEEAISLLQRFPESEWGQKLLIDFAAEYEAMQAS